MSEPGEWLRPLGAAAISEMTETIRRAGLGQIEVPEQLRAGFRGNRDAWAWASTGRLPSGFVYLFEHAQIAPRSQAGSHPMSLEASWSDNFEDYMVLGHRGHGLNSYGFGIQLRLGSVALAVQHSWGGIHTEDKEASDRIKEANRSFRKLLEQLPDGFEMEPLQWAALFSDFRLYNDLLEKRPETPHRGDDPNEWRRRSPGVSWRRVPGWIKIGANDKSHLEPTRLALATYLDKLASENKGSRISSEQSHGQRDG